MRFGDPRWLWSLVLVPLLALGLILHARLTRRQWLRAADGEMLESLWRDVSRGKLHLKTVLWLFGLACGLLAMARPQYGATTVKQSRRGLDLVIAIDTSKSMLAKDLLPDRLARAKLELASLLDQLRGDRVGFVAFAGQAFVQCPLTSDYSAAKVFLRALDTQTIPRGGTAIAEALRTADSLLDEARARGGAKSQVVVVLTDGEDHEGDALAVAKQLREKGVSIFTVGVGSTVGEPIPSYNDKGDFTGYLKDGRGNTVLSRLNEQMLKDLAAAGGGSYTASSAGSTGVEQLIADLAGFEREERDAAYKVVYADRFQWVLLPGALALLGAALLSTRRRRSLLAAFAAVMLTGSSAHADAGFPWPTLQNSDVAEANDLLLEGKLDEAIGGYDKAKAVLSDRAELWLNHGLALLKKGDPQAAEGVLERALLSEDRKLRAKAQYLLGNAAFDAQDFKKAVEAYKKSLREDPSSRDTKFNLELALQRLRKQEEEQKKKDQQNQDQQKQDQKNQDDKKDDQKDDQKEEQTDNKQDQQKQDQQKQEPQQQDQQKQDPQKPEQQQGQQGAPEQPKDDRSESREQLLNALQAEEKPLRFDLFKAQQQKRKQKTVEKDW